MTYCINPINTYETPNTLACQENWSFLVIFHWATVFAEC